MKNAIKLILVALFLFIFINADGQTLLVKGGFNATSLASINNSGNRTQPFEFKKGLHLGFLREEELFNNVFLEAGPLLQMKGTHYNIPYNVALTTVYLDLPILFKVYYKLTDDVSWYNTFGIYTGIGVHGQYWQGDEKVNIKWEESRYGLKRLDVGLAFGLGFVFEEVQIGFGYDRGLLNINNYDRNSSKIRNNVFRFSVAYRLAKQVKKEE